MLYVHGGARGGQQRAQVGRGHFYWAKTRDKRQGREQHEEINQWSCTTHHDLIIRDRKILHPTKYCHLLTFRCSTVGLFHTMWKMRPPRPQSASIHALSSFPTARVGPLSISIRIFRLSSLVTTAWENLHTSSCEVVESVSEGMESSMWGG